MAIKVFIVEDEIIIGRDIQGALQSMGYEVIGIAREVEGALKVLDYEKPDLVLLDIQLKGERTGIDLAQHLRKYFHLPFIFITSFANKKTVEQAVSTRPNGYLVKPFTEEDLFTSIELALFNFNEQAQVAPVAEGAEKASKRFQDSVFLKTGTVFKRVFYKDLLYLEADGLYTKLYTADQVFVERRLLRSFEDRLSAEQFMRVHRSYIINLDRVEALQVDAVLVNGTSVPLGRTYKEKLFSIIQ